jgi:hypothetical protein
MVVRRFESLAGQASCCAQCDLPFVGNLDGLGGDNVSKYPSIHAAAVRGRTQAEARVTSVGLVIQRASRCGRGEAVSNKIGATHRRFFGSGLFATAMREEAADEVGKPLILALVAGLLMVACNPLSDEGVNLTADLVGEEAVCEGDTCGGDGTGIADVEISSDRHKICWDIRDLVECVDHVTAFHIHSGAKGEVGPVVVEFSSGNQACTEDIVESVLRDISEDPQTFYVDVHSQRYPDGAARGQLAE